MQLLAQDYAEVVSALQATVDTKGHERRTSARMEVQAQVTIFPFKDGKAGDAFTCLTRDVSFKSESLFQSKQSPRDSQFVIKFPRAEGKPLLVLCVGTYCRARADGLYNVGASFVRPFDFDAAPEFEFRGDFSRTGATREEELKRIRESILG